MYTPETVLIHAGINHVLNDKSQSNTKNLLNIVKYMVDKSRKFGVKISSFMTHLWLTYGSLRELVRSENVN